MGGAGIIALGIIVPKVQKNTMMGINSNDKNLVDSDSMDGVPTKWRARYIVSLRGIGRMQFASLAVGSGDPTAN